MAWQFDEKKIAIARDVKGVSQCELAKKIGSSQQQVSQWEAGTVKPGIEVFVKICNALDSHPRFFIVQTGNDGNENVLEPE